MAPERLERWLAGFAERHGPITWTFAPDLVTVTAADDVRAWIDVTFGPLQTPPAGDEASALTKHLVQPRRLGVLLIRRGGHAVGLFQGAELLNSKVGSSYVQGTTKAGGWSQQRYARRRANQASEAFADAAAVVARILLPEVSRLDGLVCGGDRQAVTAVLSAPALAPLRDKRVGALLDVGDPRLRTLQASPAQFRAVRIALSD